MAYVAFLCPVHPSFSVPITVLESFGRVEASHRRQERCQKEWDTVFCRYENITLHNYITFDDGRVVKYLQLEAHPLPVLIMVNDTQVLVVLTETLNVGNSSLWLNRFVDMTNWYGENNLYLAYVYVRGNLAQLYLLLLNLKPISEA